MVKGGTVVNCIGKQFAFAAHVSLFGFILLFANMPPYFSRPLWALLVLCFASLHDVLASGGPVSFFLTTVEKEITVDGRVLRLDASAERVMGYGAPGQSSSNNFPMNDVSAFLLRSDRIDAVSYLSKRDGVRPAPSAVEAMMAGVIPVSRQRAEERQLRGTRLTHWAVNPATLVVVDLDLGNAFPSIGKGPATITLLACLNQEQSHGDAKTRLDRALEIIKSGIIEELDRRGFSVLDWNNARSRMPGEMAAMRVVTAFDWELGAPRATELMTAHLNALRINEAEDAAKRAEITQAALDYYSNRKAKALATYQLLAEREQHPIALAMLSWEAEGTDKEKQTRFLVEAKAAATRWEQKRKASVQGMQNVVFGFGSASRVDGDFMFSGGSAPKEKHRNIDFITKIYSEEGASSHHEAYLHYISGIFTDKQAKAATDPAQKAKLSEAAEEYFEKWESAMTFIVEQDVFHRRALAIALGLGVRGQFRNAEKAHEHLLALETLGLTDVKNRIGLLHFDEQLGEQSRPLSAAFKFKEGSLLGDRAANYNLGLAYAFGIGVGKDFEEAERQFKIAREGGFFSPVMDAVVGKKLPASWKASNASGDHIEVSLLDGRQIPAYFQPFDPKGKSNEDRLISYRVRYRLVSATNGRVFPQLPRVDRGVDRFSSSPLLSGEGEHIVWVSSTRPARLVQEIRIYLMNAETRRELVGVEVPIAAAWSSYAP